MNPPFPYEFGCDGVAFTVTNPADGIYDITVTGDQVLLICPGGGEYTMNIMNVVGARGQGLDSTQLEAEVLERWRIVVNRSGHNADALVPRH